MYSNVTSNLQRGLNAITRTSRNVHKTAMNVLITTLMAAYCAIKLRYLNWQRQNEKSVVDKMNPFKVLKIRSKMKFLNHKTNEDETTYNIIFFMHGLHDMSRPTTNFLFWSLLCICIGKIWNLNIVFLRTDEDKVFLTYRNFQCY